MQKNKLKVSIQIIGALFLIAINLIEFIRPATNWPNTIATVNQDQTEIYFSDDIWSKFGSFGAQFAFFTNWTNWLFIGTIIYGWIFQKYINSYWKNALSTYLLITTIIFFMILSPFLKWGKSMWVDYIWIHEHFLVSIAWFIYILTTPTVRIKSWKKSVWITLSVPLVYFFFTLGIYINSNFTIAIYPFLNFANIFNLNLSIFNSILLSIIVIFIIICGFLTTNFLFLEINHHQTIRHHALSHHQKVDKK